MNLEATLRALDAGWPIAAASWPAERLHTFVESGASSLSTVELPGAENDIRLEEVKAWIRFDAGDSAANAAYMDTTTLYTALAYASQDPARLEHAVTPASLYDLCTFVNGAILFDHVFCLENSHFDPSEMHQLLGNEPVVIALPTRQPGTVFSRDELSGAGGFLRQFWSQTQWHMDDLHSALHYKNQSALFEEATAIRKSWKTIIDFNDKEDFWFKGDRLMKRFDSDGPVLLKKLVGLSETWSPCS
jgi:hypothetical protein